MVSTMVKLTLVSDDGVHQEAFFQPWEIDRVQAAQVGSAECRFQGSRVQVSAEDGPPEVMFAAEQPRTVLRRVDAARRAIDAPQAPEEQPVRVTNWMGQLWVLLIANAAISFVVSRIGNRLGDCLIDNYCSWPWWWLP